MSSSPLEAHGIVKPGTVHWNRGAAALYEEAVRRREGVIADSGPLVCLTGEHTGRAPHDKFLVREPSSEGNVWWGSVNRSIEPEQFTALYQAVLASLQDKELFVQDCVAGADPAYRLPIRVITERAWHSLFARTMFLPLPAGGESGEITLRSSRSFTRRRWRQILRCTGRSHLCSSS